MRTILSFLLCASLFTVALAQEAVVKGRIFDPQTDETLIGVNIRTANGLGSTTDLNGEFIIRLEPGTHQLIFSYIGYQEIKKSVTLEAGQELQIDLNMSMATNEMDMVVVSSSKYGRSVKEEVVSIDVIKPALIQKNGIVNVSDAIEKVPGVTIVDGQASIRGGSGYAYGVGSRVIMVVDDLPLLSAERSEILWDFVPIENIAQIEVLKGASSVQYGAGALNGVIQVRTDWATDEPETEIVNYYEFYGKPPNPQYKWWSDSSFFNRPHSLGTYFAHRRKLTPNVDWVFSGLAHSDQTHLREEWNQRIRFGNKFRWRAKGVEGLVMEFHSQVFYRNTDFFFFWDDWGPEGSSEAEKAYLVSDGVNLQNENVFFTFDPKLSYYDQKGNTFSFKSRYYLTKDVGRDSKPESHMYYTDFSWARNFSNKYNLLVGMNPVLMWAINREGGGFGRMNFVSNGGLYVQGDARFGRLLLDAGFRTEYLYIYSEKFDLSSFQLIQPVGRLGLNYRVKDHNFLRAFGAMSYRVPSMPERYVRETLGTIQILPNPDIKTEVGYSVELGYKRELKIGGWNAYYDMAVFWQEYKDYVEFTFGRYRYDNSPVFGFKSLNIANARIAGLEMTLNSNGKIGPVELNSMIGYTYNYPVDLNVDTTSKKFFNFIGDAASGFNQPTDDLVNGMLRYRYRHMLNLDIGTQYKRLSSGFSLNFYSYIDKIDGIFVLAIDGLRDYRNEVKGGSFVMGYRIGYDFTDNFNVNLSINNLTNADFALRPAKPSPPRSFTLQTRFVF